MDALVAVDYHRTVSIELHIFAVVVTLGQIVFDPAILLDE